MKYYVFQIVLTTEEYGSHKFVIIGFNDDETYKAISLGNKKKYNIKDSQIQSVVGEMSETHELLQEKEFDADATKNYCLAKAKQFPQEAIQWKYVSKLQRGDKIRIIHRKMNYPAKFIGINFNKPVYSIQVIMLGKVTNCRINAVVPSE